ncbi:MAG: hypothetical protein JW812_01610 [Alphaproteobacteria bacterium]|nr:hypothetical protein [Alphaproteobacteria bacterium]MBN2780188.1 hypothetical protein [Alphaproteobacteria bacterium]
MKKDIFTFFGIFMTVLLTSTSAFAQAANIAAQAATIIERIKPLVFIGAAIFLVWKGIEGVIEGGKTDIWKDVGKLAFGLGVFLIAGALINMFVPADNAVNFLNTPTAVGQ